jgi:hypothetical protein
MSPLGDMGPHLTESNLTGNISPFRFRRTSAPSQHTPSLLTQWQPASQLAATVCMTHKLQTTTDHRIVKAIICRPFDWGRKSKSQ